MEDYKIGFAKGKEKVPTYLYLQKGQNIFSKFMSFHNYSPNQMLIEIYGLDGSKAIMTHAFPEKRLEEKDLSKVDFLWQDLTLVNKKIDHITYHRDGGFHIKTDNEEVLYIEKMKHTTPLGPDVEQFLRIDVVSEFAREYSNVELPLERPNLTVSVHSDRALTLEAVFSGSRYDLESKFSATLMARSSAPIQIAPMLRIRSGTIKGLFFASTDLLSPQSTEKKPLGAFIAFKFDIGNGNHVVKGFFFK